MRNRTGDAATPHPIIETAIQSLGKSDDACYRLDADGVERIRRRLEGIAEIEELKVAVRELVLFAWAMKTQKASEQVADAIFVLVDGHVRAALARGADVGELALIAKSFAKLLDTSTPKIAPTANEPKPAGAVTLGLAMPVRLR